MEKIQSTTVCQEGVENGMKNVFTGVPDMSTSVPYFIRDPPIPSTLEGEENWDADNYETYTPNLDRDIIRQPLIGKSKKIRKNFDRQSGYDMTNWKKKKMKNKNIKNYRLLYK
ncbi:hypothetical protein JTB14_032420 [Gonioctena quinquepunctata]|nr:hypothetical protein JTB14_032420 [Gonioctena quinquepunctata]